MKTKRIKATGFQSRAQFDDAIDQVAVATVLLRTAEAMRDEEIQRVRSLYEPQVVEHQERIKSLSLAAEKFAEENRDELLPGKGKSAETALAKFGFRTGMPALKTLSKWTWPKVLAAITERKLSVFIRNKPELNKEALIEAIDEGMVSFEEAGSMVQLPTGELGVKVEQSETFFIEPKDKAPEGAL